MDRVTIRARSIGAIGYVCLPTDMRCSLAQLRGFINDQLSMQAELPVPFAFVCGGLKVSPAQEELEELMACDVFITDADPYSMPAKSSPRAGSHDSFANKPFRRATNAQSLVQQWVDAFSFMEGREQLDAISLLRLQHPTLLEPIDSAPSTAKSERSMPLGNMMTPPSRSHQCATHSVNEDPSLESTARDLVPDGSMSPGMPCAGGSSPASANIERVCLPPNQWHIASVCRKLRLSSRLSNSAGFGTTHLEDGESFQG